MLLPADCCRNQKHVANAVVGKAVRAEVNAAAAAAMAAAANVLAFCLHWGRSEASQSQARTSRPKRSLEIELVPTTILKKLPKSLLQPLEVGNASCCCLHERCALPVASKVGQQVGAFLTALVGLEELSKPASPRKENLYPQAKDHQQPRNLASVAS